MEKIKYHILVVDDDDRIRELVKEYIKKMDLLFQQLIVLKKQKLR